jgi:hypothetical protein
VRRRRYGLGDGIGLGLGSGSLLWPGASSQTDPERSRPERFVGVPSLDRAALHDRRRGRRCHDLKYMGTRFSSAEAGSNGTIASWGV